MRADDDKRLPADLEQVADRLRAERREATPLELDQIKMRVLARSARPSSSRSLRRRLLIPVVALSLMAGATGGVIAGTNNGKGNDSAAKSQYKPGKGCGDKNHTHEREDECKKPPK